MADVYEQAYSNVHRGIHTLSERATMIFDNNCGIANDPGKEERIAISRT